MKFTLSWLKYHLKTESSLEELTDKLSMLGLEVETIRDQAKILRPFKISCVTSVNMHPNADRLKICKVDAGDGIVQVVCGAPNVREGMKGVFAPAGTYIPGTELTLKSTTIRGQESHGMLCSEREMGLSDDHEGIIELPLEAPTGEKWASWSGLDDPVIEIALTPNRGDCASVRGIARDLAASGLGTLRPLPKFKHRGSFDSPIKWQRQFSEDEDNACPIVAGRFFRNVRNGESPAYIQNRLRAIGLRPISLLVDITNWLTFDLGRPLHVFDADKLSGDLTIRLSHNGEKIIALDGQTYTLPNGVIVIADKIGLQGIGGLMGGMLSSCDENTKNVFLEVALFDPVRIAEAGRKLGISSDARYRFERGIDQDSLEWGCEIASQMIMKLCGGEASQVTTNGKRPRTLRKRMLKVSRVKALTGVDMPTHIIVNILENLGFKPRQKDAEITVSVPSWRPDIDGEADLVEEVLRVYGYENIPEIPLFPPKAGLILKRPLSQTRVERVRRKLASCGLVEAVTYSFINSKHAEYFGGVKSELSLVNPISSDLDVMRPSVLPGLLTAVARNQSRGVNDIKLFEVGPVYQNDKPDGQQNVACGLRVRSISERHWSEARRNVDAIDSKSDAMAALDYIGIPINKLDICRDAPKWFHPGKSASLRLGKVLLGHFGELHPTSVDAMQVLGPISAFEIYLDNLPQGRAKGLVKETLKLPTLHPVYRDFAFIVDKTVEAGEVTRAVLNADRGLITDATLFDVYQGKGMEDNKKSLGIMVVIQPEEETLTDEKIESVSRAVVDEVEKRTGGILRK